MSPRFVYVIAFRDDGFVMVRHRARAWEMPGGRLEEGESPEEGARREFIEETGMVLREIVGEMSVGRGSGRVLVGIAGNRISCELSDDISNVDTFSSLPADLSFPRAEYEGMLAKAKGLVESFKAGKNIGAPASPRKPIDTE